jgi:hypothetical protein
VNGSDGDHPHAAAGVAWHGRIDTRWAAKGDDLVWNGYKVHISETCRPCGDGDHGEGEGRTPPNLTVAGGVECGDGLLFGVQAGERPSTASSRARSVASGCTATPGS